MKDVSLISLRRTPFAITKILPKLRSESSELSQRAMWYPIFPKKSLYNKITLINNFEWIVFFPNKTNNL